MPNRLSESTSPYLLQHKDNPVHWWEWSDEAFEEARERDVPVLLSVGYSACHWCHVMAHESFEDEETAAEMNRLFVNIKVDREERPDVDSIYMEAVQAMTGRGGWPMTVWMTPDRRPFFTGTYFPKDPHRGMPSFRQVMAAVSDAWATKREGVENQADQLMAAITREIPTGDRAAREDLDSAARQIMTQFDSTFGGFGGAPKFPQQPVLEFLLRYRQLDPSVDSAIRTTLRRMADGGIHDHLAGGFARYSVDERWLVPHFEKMLYDNAQLARIYLWAGIEFGDPPLTSVATKTLDYLIRYMRDQGGGFYSAEDADSEGVEGKFYVWTVREIEEVLGSDAAAAMDYYGVTPEGNFEGKNILHLQPGRQAPKNLESMNEKLLERRDRRVRPGLDDKVVASWNGLAIRAFAEAGAALSDETYLQAARDAAQFLITSMIIDGTLMRSWRDGRHSGPGYLDDYAAAAMGLYALYEATGEIGYFDVAEDLVDGLVDFERAPGEFFTTRPDDGLVKRPKDLTDNPQPSGNALAAEALLYSSLFTGDQAKRDRSIKALEAVGAIANQYPSMVGHHLAVAVAMETGTRELAIVGSDRSAMTEVFWSSFRPGVVMAQADGETDTVPLLEGRTAQQGKATAYVCRDFVCDLPVTEPTQLAESLRPK